MSALLPVVLLAVFFACVAMMFNEGLWNNAIMFFNVMMAALLATNYFEPLADWLQRKDPSYMFVVDFLSVWAIFAVVLVVLRLATDKISRVKVRFKRPVDIAGGIFFAAVGRLDHGLFHHFHAAHGAVGPQLHGWRVPRDAGKRDVFRLGAGSEMARLCTFVVRRRLTGP